MKNKELNRWFWRWHIIAGLITLPIMLVLSVTGIIYLFKTDYNNNTYRSIVSVEQAVQNSAPHKSYQQQLNAVKQKTGQHVMQVFLPTRENQATGFRLHGKGHSRNMVYVNPYTGNVTGEIHQKQTLMYKVRKLHGELLLNTPGTLLVEFTASWFLVLIITGLYIWWPAKNFSLAGFFTLRANKNRRLFWRDIHAVFGFWLSLFMLIILAGGMPWTQVFGGQLTWLQEKTQTGYPQQWRSSELTSTINGHRLSLDNMIAIAKNQQLKGIVSITLPMGVEDVFKVSNRSFWLRDQQVLYFDQYSGHLKKSYDWSEVGVLMNLRQIAMRLHQGEYGLSNWLFVLIVTLLFTISTIAGLVSYILRKPKNGWGLPKVPAHFTVGRTLVFIIIGLGIVFPLLGISLVVLWLYHYLSNKIILKTPVES